jgi:hypothetical protein
MTSLAKGDFVVLKTATNLRTRERSANLAQGWMSLSSLELRELVHCVVQRIKVGGEQIDSSQAGGRCFDPLGRCKCTPSRKAVFGW